MKEFKIPVEWANYGVVTIEAETLESAIDIAREDENIPLPEGSYIESSWEVNNDLALIKILNNLK